MNTETYSNGCPKVGWCITCDRQVPLMAVGWPVPHQKKRGRGLCNSDYINLEEHAEMAKAGGKGDA